MNTESKPHDKPAMVTKHADGSEISWTDTGDTFTGVMAACATLDAISVSELLRDSARELLATRPAIQAVTDIACRLQDMAETMLQAALSPAPAAPPSLLIDDLQSRIEKCESKGFSASIPIPRSIVELIVRLLKKSLSNPEPQK